ncbi:hypothetical protein SAMN05446037_1001401 [Anaerovirgula multivorans]|uniref:Uncharacterized protein n=1 Tax=Anaerovirgula multivorans TaxID=312168 RepID=A0A239A822_9FIRM|nr:hypothetical protein [Anaerovirgula multivorans]SNR91659.1 hypothetical protein SAMN05446037_1001401 [Anaerovirgula multivorans]
MKAIDIKNKILWGVALIGCLGLSYWLCRFAFFKMHGMKSWSNTLAMVSLIIIVIASIVGRRILSVATVAGYMGGFVFAMVFNTDGIDPGGGATNNAWMIWSIVFIVCLLIGLIVNIIYKGKIQKQHID